eukprot:sb/3470243/
MKVVWILVLTALVNAKFEIDGTVPGVNLETNALQFEVTGTASQNGPGNKTYELGLTSGNLTVTLQWSELKFNDTYFRYLEFSKTFPCTTVTELPDESVEEEDVTFAMENVTWKLVYQEDEVWLLYDETLFLSLDMNSTCFENFTVTSLSVDLSQFSGTYDTGKIINLSNYTRTSITREGIHIFEPIIPMPFYERHLGECLRHLPGRGKY